MAGTHALIAVESLELETGLSVGIPPASAVACRQETRSPFHRALAAATACQNHSQRIMTLPAATGWKAQFNG